MERLTDKKEADVQRRKYEIRLKQGYPRNIPEERFLRLAAYEETGLEPEEIKRAFNEDAVLKLAGQVLGIEPDRLRELAQADREGRCVVLPAKLHDKLYYVDKEQVRETEVESIHNWTSGRWKLSTHTDRQSTHWIGYEVDFDGIGKTVFLTREEAEKALLRREQE